jgi:hypothetical protein
MRLSKLDLVAIALVAGGFLLLEYRNRVSIEAPKPAQASAQVAPVCPVNESVPFNAECVALIQATPARPGLRRLNDAELAGVASPELP